MNVFDLQSDEKFESFYTGTLALGIATQRTQKSADH